MDQSAASCHLMCTAFSENYNAAVSTVLIIFLKSLSSRLHKINTASVYQLTPNILHRLYICVTLHTLEYLLLSRHF